MRREVREKIHSETFGIGEKEARGEKNKKNLRRALGKKS